MVVTLVNIELEKSVAVVMPWFEACFIVGTVRIRAPQSNAFKMSRLQETF